MTGAVGAVFPHGLPSADPRQSGLRSGRADAAAAASDAAAVPGGRGRMSASHPVPEAGPRTGKLLRFSTAAANRNGSKR